MYLPRIPGGLVLAPPPAVAAGSIRPSPLPARLYLPLVQAGGAALICRVRPGQQVRRGEALAIAADAAATVLPAPASGQILGVEPHTLPDGSEAPTLVLQTDGRDETQLLPPMPDWQACTPAVLRQGLAQAGIVGLGGGAFPAARKLEPRIETLILNGAECEPYIACDEALMRERADEIVAGAALLAHIVSARDVVIALEDRMTAAAAAIGAALAQRPGPRLQLVPTVYPQGGERQLVQVICGREVPSGAYPPAIGVLVHNVATALAAWRAVVHGEALTTRIVSVGGRGVASPGNLEVRLGSLVEDVIAAAGGYTAQAARLILGGPLMGVALPHDRIAVGGAANSILVLGEDEVRPRAAELACIRCGDCAQACPVQLQPQELLRVLRGGDGEAAHALGLRDCIECGCCAYVCPSQIPLVDWYRNGKTALAAARAERTRADHARSRYEARNQRLLREQAEKVARVAARREALQQEQAAVVAEVTTDTVTPAVDAPAQAAPAAVSMDKSAVLAAIARGRAKRAAAAAPEPPQETS